MPTWKLPSRYCRRDQRRRGAATRQEVQPVSVPPDERLMDEYHALLDRYGVEACRKRSTQCESCCLLAVCPTGAEAAGRP